MKYNILICDDEPIICEGMANALKEMEDLTVFCVHSGLDALDVLAKEKIDSIILDIHMPLLDGLETLRRIREDMNSDIPVVIISGYDTFDYAQQALRYGCMDYHLKPLKPEKIREIVRQLIEKAENKAIADHKINKIYNELNTIRPIIHDRLFFDIIEQSIDEQQLSNLYSMAGIDFRTPFWQVAVMEALSPGAIRNEEEHQIRLYAVGETLRERIQAVKNIKFFNVSAKTFAFIIGLDSPGENEPVIALCEDLLTRILNDYALQFNIGIGNPVNALPNLRISYKQAQKVNLLCSSHHYGGVVRFSDIEPQKTHIDFNTKLEYLLSGLNSKTIVQSRSPMMEFLEDVAQNSTIDSDAAMVLCTKIILAGLDIMEKISVPLTEFCDTYHYHPLYALSAQHTSKDLCDRTRFIYDAIVSFISQNEKKMNTRIIEQSKLIMKENCTNENLSVGYIAGRLFLSNNYFGQLFKSSTGISVTEYINYARIEHAKHLLKNSNKKIYEISAESGFADQYYFSSVFKKVIGLTPSEYRDAL